MALNPATLYSGLKPWVDTPLGLQVGQRKQWNLKESVNDFVNLFVNYAWGSQDHVGNHVKILQISKMRSKLYNGLASIEGKGTAEAAGKVFSDSVRALYTTAFFNEKTPGPGCVTPVSVSKIQKPPKDHTAQLAAIFKNTTKGYTNEQRAADMTNVFHTACLGAVTVNIATQISGSCPTTGNMF